LLDRLEFSIAFKLIRNRLAGLAMPTSLPDSMKQISGPPPPQPIHIPPRPLSAYGSLSMGSSPNLYMAAAGGPAGMGGIPQMQMRPGFSIYFMT
jgi:hypothetical protein